MDNIKLKKGQEITLNIPFIYIIGDIGYHTNKELNTIQRCKDEIFAELESGVLLQGGLIITVEKSI